MKQLLEPSERLDGRGYEVFDIVRIGDIRPRTPEFSPAGGVESVFGTRFPCRLYADYQ